MLRIYTYKNCSTCRQATRWLRERGVGFEEIPIRETPPTEAELTDALTRLDGGLRRLFNTSGADYRQLDLKNRLPDMTDQEAVELLAGNGNLIKRPFVIGERTVLTGFKPEEWEKAGL